MPEHSPIMHALEQEMAAIISDSNNAYHARDKAQSEMMALRQQVLIRVSCDQHCVVVRSKEGCMSGSIRKMHFGNLSHFASGLARRRHSLLRHVHST